MAKRQNYSRRRKRNYLRRKKRNFLRRRNATKPIEGGGVGRIVGEENGTI
jgi:hypothetical protein